MILLCNFFRFLRRLCCSALYIHLWICRYFFFFFFFKCFCAFITLTTVPLQQSRCAIAFPSTFVQSFTFCRYVIRSILLYLSGYHQVFYAFSSHNLTKKWRLSRFNFSQTFSFGISAVEYFFVRNFSSPWYFHDASLKPHFSASILEMLRGVFRQ